MKFLCKLGFHNWTGCRCARCGETRDGEHDWSADCEECSKCRKRRSIDHSWAQCKCSKCKKVRDIDHRWKDCACSLCGKPKRELFHISLRAPYKIATDRLKVADHDWSKGYQRCVRCGVTGYEACCDAVDANDLEGIATLLRLGLDPAKNQFLDGLYTDKFCDPLGPPEGTNDQRPLGRAVMGDRIDVLRIMADHGVSFLGRFRGDSLLHRVYDVRVVEFLLTRGLDVNCRNEDYGTTPLHETLNPSIIDCLIKHGANIEATTKNEGWTPLHHAAANCDTAAVKALLKHGANRKARTKKGKTPYDIAIEEGEYSAGQKTTLELLR